MGTWLKYFLGFISIAIVCSQLVECRAQVNLVPIVPVGNAKPDTPSGRDIFSKAMKYLISILTVFLFQSCLNTPVNPPEELPELVQVWSYEHGIVGDASPVVSGATVFASRGLYLFALDEETGELIWQTQIDNDNELQGEALFIKGQQIVANHLEGISGWNKSNGEWEYIYSVTDNGYVFSTYNSKIFEFDVDGKLIFEKLLDENYIVHGVTYSEAKFFTGQSQTIHGALTLGCITALDAENSDSVWVYDTDNGGFVRDGPIFENSILYVGAMDNSPLNEVVALDAETGEVIWQQANDYMWTRAFALGPRHVYVNTGGSLAALDKKTGELKWREEWLGTASTKPVYLGDYVYHTNYSELMVIEDETGEVVHRELSPDGTAIWHIAASSDKIFAQTSWQLIAYQSWHLRED